MFVNFEVERGSFLLVVGVVCGQKNEVAGKVSLMLNFVFFFSKICVNERGVVNFVIARKQY